MKSRRSNDLFNDLMQWSNDFDSFDVYSESHILLIIVLLNCISNLHPMTALSASDQK